MSRIGTFNSRCQRIRRYRHAIVLSHSVTVRSDEKKIEDMGRCFVGAFFRDVVELKQMIDFLMLAGQEKETIGINSLGLCILEPRIAIRFIRGD